MKDIAEQALTFLKSKVMLYVAFALTLGVVISVTLPDLSREDSIRDTSFGLNITMALIAAAIYTVHLTRGVTLENEIRELTKRILYGWLIVIGWLAIQIIFFEDVTFAPFSAIMGAVTVAFLTLWIVTFILVTRLAALVEGQHELIGIWFGALILPPIMLFAALHWQVTDFWQITETHSCSRCGTPVLPDSISCPRCGAVFSGTERHVVRR